MKIFKATFKQILSVANETGTFLSALGRRCLKGRGGFFSPWGRCLKGRGELLSPWGRCLKGRGVILSLLLPLISLSQTIEVKQDGTGDYTQIQEAIDHAWPGDTVLVWPGTYYENLTVNEKGIILGSLLMTTGDQDYKYSTIIDGGQNAGCISVKYVDTSFELNGFTIINGNSRDYGGGIKIWESITKIKNCIIKNNFSYRGGGGISCVSLNYYRTTKLNGNSITNNHTYGPGGGIAFSTGLVVFDSIHMNSVYNNFAERGTDLHYSGDNEVDVYLDTCTVLIPDTYFVSSIQYEGYQDDDINLSVQNGAIQPYDGDIYVNPNTGNDQNSGTSWEEPLKSIAWAYHKIHVDSSAGNTIYLANGTYSDTTNNEKFPLNIRPFTNLVGSSREGTILDGNEKVKLLKGNNNITDFAIKKMTLTGGPLIDYDDYSASRAQVARLYTGCARFEIDSIVFSDSYAYDAVGVLTYYQADSSVVRNCLFKDNTGGHAIRTASDGDKTQFINNCIVTNQQPDENVPPNRLMMGKVIDDGGTGRTIVQNSLFYNNPRMGVSRWPHGNSYFVNCTFADNSWYDQMAFAYVADAGMHFYNCIAWNLSETPFAINVGEWQKMEHSYLNIYNSLIEGGEESITIGSLCFHHDTNWCHVHYDPTNIDADPNFLGMWDHPYQIADGSPCIDAGTLANLPDFIELPETDLAGNPRIVGDSIDMGAYEWNPTIVGFNEIGPDSREKKEKLLRASPNPFDWGTYVEVDPEYSGEANTEYSVEVYDNYGRLVRNILSTTIPGKQEVLWYGDDNNGNPLPAGIYHIVLFSGEREIESLKVVKR